MSEPSGPPPAAPAAPSAARRPAPPPRKTGLHGATIFLLGLTAFGMLVFLASVGAVVWLVAGRSGGKVLDGTYLQVDLGPELVEAPVIGGLYLDPDDEPPLVTDIARAIRAAATDERIEGLYLTIDGTTPSLAAVQELRDAIGVLRTAGKPCVVYAESYTTSQYYLATTCDRVAMAPTGVALVTGLGASVTYYADTFEKIGVNPEFEHVGDFKSAVEPYERNGPSEPASLAMNELLDSMYDQVLTGIAAGRGRDAAEVQAWIDVPTLAPRVAHERGMVDLLAYPDEIRGHITQLGDDDFVAKVAEPVEDDEEEVAERFTRLKRYLATLRDEASSGDAVAVVYASGPIVSGETGGLFAEQVIADRTFGTWMKDIRETDEVKAVVLRVDSPGGSGLASDLIWREIQRTRAAGKPVVVSMAGYAASGGYYISAPADHVVAQPGTLTGSIGVFGGKLDLSGTYEKLGLKQATWERGAEARLFSLSAPFSDTGRAVFREFLTDFYETFLARVAEGRKMDRDAVHTVAQGRVWTGQQALERGLVDELGGLDIAVAKAAELGGIDGTPALRRWPVQKSFFEVLIEDMDGGDATALAPVVTIPGIDVDALTDLLVLERVLSDGAAALLPGNLTVQ
jgi:protease-4